MSWEYGLKRDKNGWLELAEIYGCESYTLTPIVVSGGEDYQELVDNLKIILKDLEDPTIVDIEYKDKKTFKLSKKEFITRSMKGDIFELDGKRYFYDDSCGNPFRVDGEGITAYWSRLDGTKEFTLVEPEPTIERRWKWLIDEDGYTSESNYMSDEYVEENDYASRAWYKKEDDYRDVVIKDDMD